jgi:radical SAM superfamily enzyme YgiQ (UPF0313 family)
MSRARIRDALGRLVQSEVRRLPLRPEGPLRFAVVYPNTYEVGMANLGLHAVLECLDVAGVVAERAFLPDRRGLADHQRSGTPVLTLESGRPLSDFDVLLFSVSFEPDYVGLVQVLELCGLAPLAADRGRGAPLVVIGGIAPSLNPEPVALLCDLIGIGEAEALLPDLVEALVLRPDREELTELALPGWYAPRQGPHETTRAWVAELDRPACPVVLSPRAAFAAHVDLEISRGCRWRCRFCAAGHVITPYREVALDAALPRIAWATQQRARVGLVGTDVSDHAGLLPIAEAVWEREATLALPSLRVERLARSAGAVAQVLRRERPRTLTMAVEAATEPLRAGLGKRLSDEQVLRAAEHAGQLGVQTLRLYLLVGIPGEAWEEIEAIIELAQRLSGEGPALSLSINGLVPKAGTPFQWEAAPELDYLRRVRRLLRKGLPERVRGDLSFESPDWTRWQALLSLGDRSTTDYILLAAREGWRRALAQATQHEGVLQGRARDEAAPLPWSHIAPHGGQCGQLARERLRCQRREYVPPQQV